MSPSRGSITSCIPVPSVPSVLIRPKLAAFPFHPSQTICVPVSSTNYLRPRFFHLRPRFFHPKA